MKNIVCLSFVFVFLLIQGCSDMSGDYKELASLSDTVSASGLSGDSVKLVKKASIHVKVKDVEQSARTISAIAKNMGGMIFDQQLETIEAERKELKLSQDSLLVITKLRPQASITARVPWQHLETFLDTIADLGYFTGSSRLHIDDKSILYLQNSLKEQARTNILANAPKQVKKYEHNLYSVMLRDEAIDQQISNRYIDADVNYSTIDMLVFQNDVVRKEVVANYILSDYRLPVGTRLVHAFSDGWISFTEFILIIARLWTFAVLIIGVTIIYRYWRRRAV